MTRNPATDFEARDSFLAAADGGDAAALLAPEEEASTRMLVAWIRFMIL
jgi:hypothetical protein